MKKFLIVAVIGLSAFGIWQYSENNPDFLSNFGISSGQPTDQVFGNDLGVEDDDYMYPENFWVASNTNPQDAIAGALGFYCTSAPYKPSMWSPVGSSGLFSTFNIRTGVAFYVKLSGGSEPNTTVLTANDSNAQNQFDAWGCQEPMVIDVG